MNLLASTSGGDVASVFAVAISVLALAISHRQYVTAHNKLRLDLFEKRFAVYRGLTTLLQKVDGGLTDEDIARFSFETHAKFFLFGQDVIDFLKVVHDKASDLVHLRAYLEDDRVRDDDKRDRKIEEELALKRWFRETISSREHVRVFTRYLNFADVSLSND